jgi:DNA repair and recombination protein RAD52
MGPTLLYVEGWHVIAEANLIFGYDAWDRERCLTEY